MFWDRIRGVFTFHAATFEEIEHDPSATRQALWVVMAVAVLTGLGAGIGALYSNRSFWVTFAFGFLWTFVSWFLWGAIAYWLGTRIFKGEASLSETLRTIGFAYAPLGLAIIPFIGGLIGAIYTTADGFLAIRQSLDLEDLQAFVTIVLGFVVYVIGVILINDLITLLGVWLA